MKSVQISEYDRLTFFSNLSQDQSIYTMHQAECKGIRYSIGMIFVIQIGDNDLPNFGKIINIFSEGTSLYLLLQPLISRYFDENYYAYNVQESVTFILKNVNQLPDTSQCLYEQMSEGSFVATKYLL